MISAFVQRRPWATALVALIFGPIGGMLYLGKGRLAGAYLLVTLVAFTIPYLLAHVGLLPLAAETTMWILYYAVHFYGVFHSYRTAARLLGEVPTTWYARWYVAIVLVWVVGYGSALSIRTFLWEPFHLPASSMRPGLEVGDHFFVSKFAYRSSLPEPGDLVVFLLPSDNETAFVKRLIGLPGDRIQLKAGLLFLNGAQVPRSNAGFDSAEENRNDEQIYRESLPNGRSYLIIERSDQMPLDNTEVFDVPAGHYSLLGDNRDKSMDSRSLSRVGYVPAENLIGRVAISYWNSERQKILFLEDD